MARDANRFLVVQVDLIHVLCLMMRYISMAVTFQDACDDMWQQRLVEESGDPRRQEALSAGRIGVRKANNPAPEACETVRGPCWLGSKSA